MEKNENKERNTVVVVIVDCIIAVFFMLLGYWISAIIGFIQQADISIVDALLKVISKPFGNYFNSYSPILMLLGVVLAEFSLFLYLYLNKNNSNKVSDSEDETVNEIPVLPRTDEEAENVSFLSKVMRDEEERTKTIDEKVDVVSDFNVVLPDDEDLGENKQSIQIEKEGTTIESEFVIEFPQEKKSVEIDNKLFAELATEYEVDQICAMLKITEYMEGVSAGMLKKMFAPTMPADEIQQYIKIFYG